MKLLAAEAGVDRHHEQEVGQGERVLEGVERGGRVDGDAGRHAALPDPLERAVEVAARLDVDRHPLDAGRGQAGDQGVGVADHEVGVERELAAGGEALHHRRAESEIGDEAAVHDVEVEQVGAGTLDVGHLTGEVGEVGRQQRRRDADAHWTTQMAMMSVRDTGEPCRRVLAQQDAPGRGRGTATSWICPRRSRLARQKRRASSVVWDSSDGITYSVVSGAAG